MNSRMWRAGALRCATGRRSSAASISARNGVDPRRPRTKNARSCLTRPPAPFWGAEHIEGKVHARQPALEAPPAWLDLGRLGSRRPARPLESADPGKGSERRRGGQGGKNLLPVVAARLSGEDNRQPAPPPAEADAHRAQ